MATGTAVRTTLLVIYTERIDECRDFYARLGLDFARERHGTGPEHFAATLGDGTVVELYPAVGDQVTGRLRLGLAVAGHTLTPPLTQGRRICTDPDGRVVDLHIT